MLKTGRSQWAITLTREGHSRHTQNSTASQWQCLALPKGLQVKHRGTVHVFWAKCKHSMIHFVSTLRPSEHRHFIGRHCPAVICYYVSVLKGSSPRTQICIKNPWGDPSGEPLQSRARSSTGSAFLNPECGLEVTIIGSPLSYRPFCHAVTCVVTEDLPLHRDSLGHKHNTTLGTFRKQTLTDLVWNCAGNVFSFSEKSYNFVRSCSPVVALEFCWKTAKRLLIADFSWFEYKTVSVCSGLQGWTRVHFVWRHQLKWRRPQVRAKQPKSL